MGNFAKLLILPILDRKQINPSADLNDLETASDQHIYQLYDLTPDEIAIIETTT